jgi:sugar phosphate isomerase/epimerase
MALGWSSSPNLTFPTAPRDRIAIASYPFRDFITGGEAAPNTTPRIDLKDFAAHVKEKFGINKIEPWTGHFPSSDARYLGQFRTAVEEAAGHIVNIAVDGESSPYATDAAERERAITFSKQWIDNAVALGASSIRTNMPSAKDSAPDLNRTVDSLAKVAEHAAAKSVVVSLENDNPISEDPFFIVKVIERVNSPWLHALPDFANTLTSSSEDHAYSGIDAMFAHAYCICHVKEEEKTQADNMVHVDLPRTFGYLKKHEYKGYCSMEWDSPGDPYAGTAKLIEKTTRLLS